MYHKLNEGDIPDSSLNSGIYPVVIYQAIRQFSSMEQPIGVSDLENVLSRFCPNIKKDSLKKTIKRNLQALQHYDQNIHVEYQDECIPSYKTIVGIYYEQDLSMADVQILSDALIYSKHLSKEKKKEIYYKLLTQVGLSAKNGNTWADLVMRDIEEEATYPGDILYKNLEWINDAIHNRYCLKFSYNFLFPHNTKVVVRKYTGVSPYKILLENGVYYLIGCDRHTKTNISRFNMGIALPIIRLEIHKLRDMVKDERHEYFPSDKTRAEDWSFEEYFNAGFNIFNKQIGYHEYDVNPELKVSARGLDALYDMFGDRVIAFKSDEKVDHYAGRIEELSHYYKVSIRHFSNKDMLKLRDLLFSFPEKDLKMLNFKDALEKYKKIISRQIEV